MHEPERTKSNKNAKPLTENRKTHTHTKLSKERIVSRPGRENPKQYPLNRATDTHCRAGKGGKKLKEPAKSSNKKQSPYPLSPSPSLSFTRITHTRRKGKAHHNTTQQNSRLCHGFFLQPSNPTNPDGSVFYSVSLTPIGAPPLHVLLALSLSLSLSCPPYRTGHIIVLLS